MIRMFTKKEMDDLVRKLKKNHAEATGKEITDGSDLPETSLESMATVHAVMIPKGRKSGKKKTAKKRAAKKQGKPVAVKRLVLTTKEQERLDKLQADIAALGAEWAKEDADGIIQEPDDLPETDSAPTGEITAVFISELNKVGPKSPVKSSGDLGGKGKKLGRKKAGKERTAKKRTVKKRAAKK